MFVKQWMKTELLTIGPEGTIAAAEELFKKHRIRRLPVVAEGLLVGVVSPHDLEKAMPSILDAEGASEEEFIAANTEIRAVMTSSPITVCSDDSLAAAARKMRHHKIDGLPVVDCGRLMGIISITDILDAFLVMMTGDRTGTRLDLTIPQEPEAFYRMIKAFQKTGKEVVAIAQHYGYSADSHLVTVHVREEDNDDLLDLLWQYGVTVKRSGPAD